MSQYQNDPIIQLPNLYIDGLVAEVDRVAFNTVNISAGIARDSQNVMDIVVGSANVQNVITPAPLVISALAEGVGGLDVLPMVGGQLYAVYVIADSRYYKPTAGMLSLASNAVPKMPFGYDSYRKVGYVWSNNAVSFLAGFAQGTSNSRFFYADTPQQVLTAGASGPFAPVILDPFVPKENNIQVYLNCNFDAAAAGDNMIVGYFSTNSAQFDVIAPVAGATAITKVWPYVLCQEDPLNPGDYGVQYSVTAGTVDIFLAGFSFTV